MPTLKYTNEQKENLYRMRIFDDEGKIKKTLAWVHEKYPEEKKIPGMIYAQEHTVSAEDAERVAVLIRGGNLTVVEKKKAASK